MVNMTMADKTVIWNEVKVDVGWGVLRGKTCVVGNPYDTGDHLRVVGLHGWLDNCNTFDTLVPLLPSKVEVLVLDLPGHGLSDHLPLGAHYNPIVYACNVQTAVLKLGWKKFVLMGHSMGSAVSNLFTALFPEHVKALISLDFIGPFIVEGFVESCRTSVFDLLKAEQHVDRPPLVYSEREAIDRLVAARVFAYNEEPMLDKEAAQTLLPRSAREVNDGYIWSHDRKARSSFLSFISRRNWIDIISAIKCPFMLIRATRGAATFPDKLFNSIADVYKKNSKWCQIELVKGGHHVHLTDPELIAPTVTNFLERIMNENSLLEAKL